MVEHRKPSYIGTVLKQIKSIEVDEFRTVWYSYEYTFSEYREYSVSGVVVKIDNDRGLLHISSTGDMIYTINFGDIIGIA